MTVLDFFLWYIVLSYSLNIFLWVFVIIIVQGLDKCMTKEDVKNSLLIMALSPFLLPYSLGLIFGGFWFRVVTDDV